MRNTPFKLPNVKDLPLSKGMTHFNVFGSAPSGKDLAAWHNALQDVAAGMPMGTGHEEVGFGFNKSVTTDWGLLSDAQIMGEPFPSSWLTLVPPKRPCWTCFSAPPKPVADCLLNSPPP